MKKEKGFTLIEMLIVVATIGLLASVVLVGLGSFRSRGRDARRIADIRSVQNSLNFIMLKVIIIPRLIIGIVYGLL